MELFHPVVRDWFAQSFDSPTEPQRHAWNAIADAQHVLIAAPTGSGKTFAAFLNAIDDLVKRAVAGTLTQEVSVVYVSPLKALSNDIRHNLQIPLREINARLQALSSEQAGSRPLIQASVRTGDTTQGERSKMLRNPPHILVTTPESLYILLTSPSGRGMLGSVRTVIIDEIHAVIGNKRGSHLSLSLERLQYLCRNPFRRIGVSATQRPIERVARFLTGTGERARCEIVDSGHDRNRDLEICLPDSDLEPVMAAEVWQEVYDRLAALISDHSTTLVFVNTRKLAERVAKALGERLDADRVTSHHGSLAREHRLSAEQRLKAGTLNALVATASLELGIDIGDVDLVCQIGSPRSVNVLLQRVGRSGHGMGRVPKGRLFPLSRDDLVECTALLDAVRRGALDQLEIFPGPLDVLAQQIVAEVSAGERELDELYRQVRTAAAYDSLDREQFDRVIRMLAEGFGTRRGIRSAYIHLYTVNGRVRPRKSARLTAITNGGTIPDLFDYDVILQPDHVRIGTLNEDFSFESQPGDIFLLGNMSYRIIRVETGKVHVQDARGQPPTIPFWFGEAAGRTDVVSESVSLLRERVQDWLSGGLDAARGQLESVYRISGPCARQLAGYLGVAHAALGTLPTRSQIVFERFFDTAGDQHLVIHSPYGSRVNRAWGLALRKRFCRKFNFELQAAALEDTIVLSFGSTHSFPIEEPAGYLKPETVREVLIQALLDTPMFPTHWRWNATIALAIRRFSRGARTPPQFQRSRAEDLIAEIFPDQLACAENLSGQREIPEHPLVHQTLHDCLHDLMDIRGLERLLTRLGQGDIRLACRDLTAPSPLAEEVLSAGNFAFLDDVPAEERRTALVRARRYLDPQDAVALRHLDNEAITTVRQEAWPVAENEDECHDALLLLGGLGLREARDSGWLEYLARLAADNRACLVRKPSVQAWVAAERLAFWLSLHPDLEATPRLMPPEHAEIQDRQGSLVELVKMRLLGLGPVDEADLADFFGIRVAEISGALSVAEQEGYAMRGQFGDGKSGLGQWCERGLLARMHRRTLRTLRKQVQPVGISAFMRFLFRWQGLDTISEPALLDADPEQVASVLDQLEGYEAPAAAWEEFILPARLHGYLPYMLDMLCGSGRLSWARINSPDSRGFRGSSRQSPIAFMSRDGKRHWMAYSRPALADPQFLSSTAASLVETLEREGALFFDDLLQSRRWLASDVEQALSELVGTGLVSCDQFSGMRGLFGKKGLPGRRTGSRNQRGPAVFQGAGRWFLVARNPAAGKEGSGISELSDIRWESVEYIAQSLLRRYGVVFRQLLVSEKSCPPWRDLHYVLRRMEARGEVRGGRFVSGPAGEQFALPEAVGLLRNRQDGEAGSQVVLSACDPLNLTGILIPGTRVPASRANRLLFVDGRLVAKSLAKDIQWLMDLEPEDQWKARRALVQSARHAGRQFRIPTANRMH